jgi:phosphatidylglycerophosphatase A
VKLFHYIIATSLGLGYAPLAPGTVGSLLGIAAMYFMFPLPLWMILTIIVFGFFIGVYSSTIVEKEKGEDPSLVVIDEVVGMMISLVLVPRLWWMYGLAFLLFRFFDIVKPPPINASQKLKGGWGIMVDDLFAGIYALILMHLFLVFFR